MQRGSLARGEDEDRRASTVPYSHPEQPPPIPVFIFPPRLDFYADDQVSHKQVLTLYNPFTHVLRFKVLCTAPLRYTVVEAEGLVKPNSCIDIVTRHRDIRARNYGTTDKFRVDVWEEGASRGRGGRKDIAATLHATKPQAAERPPHVSLPWHPPSHVYSMQHGFPRTLSPWLFGLYILAGLVSMVILILPLHGDTRSLLHENLQVSVVQKLVAAYVLGLLTMVFLQG
ncbi:hypothetical protein XENTR_v10010419 [Xenopus tropicalis]|uniref:Motile sperm domain-containing protein 3 n=1 Tax=Xenopus tropicalis TaxID=8364 RepID=A0A8J1JAJ4_XENTR|nr:motile sperm domain-containing protein 3 isoform X1 [Xenopus tropicalis]XP_031753675.1 motile sperm domain-containing protein 3 isoform X1 [Xenopus tropicalis]XP_031753676.1 motile sperm domain-containing protein 3 isoform X1 [Xenopus tropicalis]KAE8620688.1 hypothetical protein XENTR_v10010419 [Xenopus tropicalis]KAE8620689.1 hypothetical protein XENTR_v10010419 [Xenopus tropicalis]KAE8620690.1 hypothetical protein XENTR_v10010419 [Xenopus tropicalis]KAE8620691.1 hypothetical protein XENT